MRRIIISLLICFSFLVSAYPQIPSANSEAAVRTVNDSVFEVGDIVKSPRILFHPDGPQSDFEFGGFQDSIRALRDFLWKNKNLVVEIGVHADYRSEAKYNETLTSRRSGKICSYLISKGIDSARLEFKGYGESKPLTLFHDLVLPSGKTILKGTTLTEKWIDANCSRKINKNDYEFVMMQNRRIELRILRIDYIPKVIFTLQGRVIENLSKEPIAGATVKLYGSDNTSVQVKTNSAGQYFFGWTRISPKTAYVVSASALEIKTETSPCGFLGNPKAKISTKDSVRSFHFQEDFMLYSILHCGYFFPWISFRKNSFDLDSAAMLSLDSLVDAMKLNNRTVFGLNSHAGYDERNATKLSFKRAKSVVDYLVSKGVDVKRIVPSGYGSSVPYKFHDGVYNGASVTRKWVRKTFKSKSEREKYRNLNRRLVFTLERRDYSPR